MVDCSCRGYNTSIEFLSSSFSVKDLRTGAILLQDLTKDGVYEWPTITTFLTSPFLAFSSVKTTSSAWHHRLGHPSVVIYKHIMSPFKLDCANVSGKKFSL